jgi:small subunit ribosomal protein S20
VANTRSARKRIRSNERKHIRNRAVRAAVRTKVSKARRALLAPAQGVDAEQELRGAISSLDRAAEKGILHQNNARRRASRLASMAAALRSATQGAEGDAAAARSAAAGGAKGRSVKPAAVRPSAKSRAKPVAKPKGRAPAPKTSARTTRGKA